MQFVSDYIKGIDLIALVALVALAFASIVGDPYCF